MIIERQNNEILIRLKSLKRFEDIQLLLNYLRYEELTDGSTATQSDVDNMVREARQGRWERIKSDFGLND
jgi:hypothetical protein